MVNNHFFISLLNYELPKITFTQIAAINANFITPYTSNITRSSADPPTNLVEWVSNGVQGTPSKMMTPIDMQIYLSFTPDSTGNQSEGLYCSQGNNQTLVDCTTKNTNTSKYLPLAKNAPIAFAYAQSNSLYLDDLLPAFLKMVSYVT